MFFEGDKDDSIRIEGNCYEERGEPVGGSDLGDAYHVFLCKGHPTEDRYHEFDTFDAILCEPLEYISGLIPYGFYGMVAKKTTTSEAFRDRTIDIFSKTM
jgi:hypothetical protein